MGLASDRDWVASNALAAIASRPPPPRRGAGGAATAAGAPAAAGAPFDAGAGARADADFTRRPGFGEAPAYLARNKAAVAEERRQVDALLSMMTGAGGVGAGAGEPMPEAERAELLAHLKAKWAALNAAYLKLGFVADTASKVKRREALERDLARVEADVRALQGAGAVVVVPDDA